MNSDIRTVHYSNGRLWLGTWGSGVFRSVDSSETTFNSTADTKASVPKSIMLNQNYPNPFNPSTTISFSLPSKAIVSLKIYDVLGREIETLVFNELSSGTHSVQWNAMRFPSGIYFYRLQTDSYAKTKRLLLLK
jgi:hypothetical protein